MIAIGIDEHFGLVYEGDGDYGRGLWPTPMITPAKFVYLSDENLSAHISSNRLGYRFREDSFDPIARIRRGRFYLAGEGQPRQWSRCAHHPGFPFDAIDPRIHAHSKCLETFYSDSIWLKYLRGKKEFPIVLLGQDNCFTSWSVIDVETIVTGENLVTLKARSSFGLLPVICNDKVPMYFQAKLNESIEVLADEYHRSSPSSVIDRARDVAVHALMAFCNLQKNAAMDLGNLIKRPELEKFIIARNVANIIARLHARAKPNEQEKRELRSIREKDADLAIQSVGTLLCEIGLAEWAS